MGKRAIFSLLLAVCFILLLGIVSAGAGLDADNAIIIGGKKYDAGYHTLTVRNADARELSEKLPLFPELETVYLLDDLPEAEELIALKESFPDVLFVWEFSVCGVSTDTRAEFLDLSGIPLADTSELEAALPFFYDLKQVDMVDCGISNDDMEALNQRHPGTKFVWALQIQGIKLRTDATSFMPTKHGYRVTDSDCQLLRYCHDLECIDLGHMTVYDCSFLYGTPHVKYLILADTRVSDATPIGFLTELEFLELFMTNVSDYTPLLNCTSLKDLNLCFSPSYDNSPLYQMTWLDRLWLVGSSLSAADQREIREALPCTMIVIHSTSSTKQGWRHGPRYYQQRDIFEMPYNIN